MRRSIKDIVFYVTLILYLILAVPVLVVWGPSGFRTLTLTGVTIFLLLGGLFLRKANKNMSKSEEIIRKSIERQLKISKGLCSYISQKGEPMKGKSKKYSIGVDEAIPGSDFSIIRLPIYLKIWPGHAHSKFSNYCPREDAPVMHRDCYVCRWHAGDTPDYPGFTFCNRKGDDIPSFSGYIDAERVGL